MTPPDASVDVTTESVRDALRVRVATVVEKTGISNTLKSELRYRLIESLHKEGGAANILGRRREVAGAEPLLAQPPCLVDRALYSLVLEFLRSREKMYSLSVLLPECGMNSSDVLSNDEVGRALNLERVKVFEACCAASEREQEEREDQLGQPLLEKLFEALAATREPVCTTHGTQTDSVGLGLSLEAKLRACETQAAAVAARDARSMEERMLQFQARCEARCKKEAEAEIARIRTIEREKIALEEAAKSRADVQEVVLKAEKEMREREQRLRAREEAALQRLKAKGLELDKKAVEWRAEAQRLLEDGLRKQQVRARQLEVEEQRLASHTKALENRERDISVRENRVDEQFAAMKAELDIQLRAFKADVEGSVVDEREAVRKRELDLEREAISQEREREKSDVLEQRLASSQKSAEELHNELRDAKQLCALRDRELEEYRKQVALMNEAGQRSQLTNDRLQSELSSLEREVESLRVEKDSIRHTEDTRQQAAAKVQALVETHAQSVQQENARLTAEIESMRNRIQACQLERDDAETRVRGRLEVAWEVERGGMRAELERLRRACEDATVSERALKEELRHMQEVGKTVRREAEELRWKLVAEIEEVKRAQKRAEVAEAEAETAAKVIEVPPKPATPKPKVNDWAATIQRLEDEFFQSPRGAETPVRVPSRSQTRITNAHQAQLEEETKRLDAEIGAFARRTSPHRWGVLGTPAAAGDAIGFGGDLISPNPWFGWAAAEEPQGVVVDVGAAANDAVPSGLAVPPSVPQLPFYSDMSSTGHQASYTSTTATAGVNVGYPETGRPAIPATAQRVGASPVAAGSKSETRAPLRDQHVPAQGARAGASPSLPSPQTGAFGTVGGSANHLNGLAMAPKVVPPSGAVAKAHSSPPPEGTTHGKSSAAAALPVLKPSTSQSFAPVDDKSKDIPSVVPSAAAPGVLPSADHRSAADGAVGKETCGTVASHFDGPQAVRPSDSRSSGVSSHPNPAVVACPPQAAAIDRPVSDMFRDESAASSFEAVRHQPPERPIDDMFKDDSTSEVQEIQRVGSEVALARASRPSGEIFNHDSSLDANEAEIRPAPANTAERPIDGMFKDTSISDIQAIEQVVPDSVPAGHRPVSDMFKDVSDVEEPEMPPNAAPTAQVERPVNDMFRDTSSSEILATEQGIPDSVPTASHRPVSDMFQDESDVDEPGPPPHPAPKSKAERPIDDMFKDESVLEVPAAQQAVADAAPTNAARPAQNTFMKEPDPRAPDVTPHAAIDAAVDPAPPGKLQRPIDDMFNDDSSLELPGSEQVVSGVEHTGGDLPIIDKLKGGPEDAHADPPRGAPQDRPLQDMFRDDSEDDDSLPLPGSQPKPVHDMFKSSSSEEHQDNKSDRRSPRSDGGKPPVAADAASSEQASVVQSFRMDSVASSSSQPGRPSGADVVSPPAVQPAVSAADSGSDISCGSLPSLGMGDSPLVAAQPAPPEQQSPPQSRSRSPSPSLPAGTAQEADVSIGSLSSVGEADAADGKQSRSGSARSAGSDPDRGPGSVHSAGSDGRNAGGSLHSVGSESGGGGTEVKSVPDEPAGAAAAAAGADTSTNSADIGARWQRELESRLAKAKLDRPAEAVQTVAAQDDEDNDVDEDESEGELEGHESFPDDESDAWG